MSHPNEKYTARERARALEMIARAVPAKEICDLLGCSQRILNYWAHRAGVRRPSNRNRRRHRADVRARAVELYSRGWSASKVAELLSDVLGTPVAHSTVVAWVREAGCEVRPLRTMDDAKIAAMRADGKTLAEIARAFGCSVSGVASSLNRSRKACA